MTESTPTETVEARIRRIMGDVDITYSGGTTTYIQPEDLRAGRIFRYIKSDVKTIDERKTNVWILTDLESGASCEMIESAQLSKHTPQEGQVFFLRFDGCQEIAGGKRVNNFTLNLYSVKARA